MSKRSILITGGAGYIGSHTTRFLANKAYNVTVIDNLERGYKQPIDNINKEVDNKVNFYKGDLRNRSDLEKVFKNENYDAVIHFAAYCIVHESNQHPDRYYQNNIVGTDNLLWAMSKYNVNKIIFSSTCVVYSNPLPEDLPITEKSPLSPINPYALSKYCSEKIVQSYSDLKDIKYIILRYFNPCGCALDAKIGDSRFPRSWLMPNAVLGALGLHDFHLTCGKVDTPDGSTIRDYFNVLDLAEAHEAALKGILNKTKNDIFNVGTGKGISTLEIIRMVKDITGVNFENPLGKARENEIPAIYANVDKFKNTFKWKPRYTLEQAVESLVKFYKKYPKGYEY